MNISIKLKHFIIEEKGITLTECTRGDYCFYKDAIEYTKEKIIVELNNCKCTCLYQHNCNTYLESYKVLCYRCKRLKELIN